MTNKRTMSGNISNNKKNIEKYVFLLTVLFHFASIIIHETIWGKDMGGLGLLLFMYTPIVYNYEYA
jgi:hypothetical protein